MTVNELAKRKAELFKAENGESYLIAVSDSRTTIAVHEIPADIFPTLDIFEISHNSKGYKLVYRAKGIYKTIVTSFPKVMTIERKIFDDLLAKGIAECGRNKVNYGHVFENYLFGTPFSEIIKDHGEIDGIWNNKRVQLKASLVTWNLQKNKNNGPSTVTICKIHESELND